MKRNLSNSYLRGSRAQETVFHCPSNPGVGRDGSTCHGCYPTLQPSLATCPSHPLSCRAAPTAYAPLPCPGAAHTGYSWGAIALDGPHHYPNCPVTCVRRYPDGAQRRVCCRRAHAPLDDPTAPLVHAPSGLRNLTRMSERPRSLVQLSLVKFPSTAAHPPPPVSPRPHRHRRPNAAAADNTQPRAAFPAIHQRRYGRPTRGRGELARALALRPALPLPQHQVHAQRALAA
ncbi:hypothetical protein C8R46DRAFT_1320320, partial [Mycena filopes]